MNVKKSMTYLVIIGVLCGSMTSKADMSDARLAQSQRAVDAYNALWSETRAHLCLQQNSPSRKIFRLLLGEDDEMRRSEDLVVQDRYDAMIVNVLRCGGFSEPVRLLTKLRALQKGCQRTGTILTEHDIRQLLSQLPRPKGRSLRE